VSIQLQSFVSAERGSADWHRARTIIRWRDDRTRKSRGLQSSRVTKVWVPRFLDAVKNQIVVYSEKTEAPSFWK